LAERSQRLLAISQAIAVEDRSVVDSLDVADPVEAAVRSWFVADGALAQRFVETQDPELNRERSAARAAIRSKVDAGLAAVQKEGQALIDASGDLAAEGAPCEGAILVRSTVLEACRTQSGPVCEEAAAAEPTGRYRFVDSPADLWDVSEFRPWSDPGPLTAAPNGEITGARSIAYARQGNAVVTVAFGPLLRQRASLTPEQVASFEAIADSLSFDFTHPGFVVAPSLAIRVTVPDPLAGETLYVLHFGSPEQAEPIWTGPAAAGAPIDAMVVLRPRQVALLASGSPISLTAIVEGEEAGAGGEAVYSIQFTPVNQQRAAQALVGYMAGQLGKDLAALLPPGQTPPGQTP